MRSAILAATALAVLLTGCSSGKPAAPPSTTTPAPTTAASEGTPSPSGDAATIAAVKAYATDLRTADAVIKGCPSDATPQCVSAATDKAAPAAAALGTALGAAPGETADVASRVPLLTAAAMALVKAIVDYQASATGDRWRQVTLASGTIAQLLDTDWAGYGI